MKSCDLKGHEHELSTQSRGLIVATQYPECYCEGPNRYQTWQTSSPTSRRNVGTCNMKSRDRGGHEDGLG